MKPRDFCFFATYTQNKLKSASFDNEKRLDIYSQQV